MTTTTTRPAPPEWPPPETDTAPDHEHNPRSARGKLLDVQGLRALAVVLVVLNHMVGWPSGGFVGVDVFFVISGFVITKSLINVSTPRPSLGSYVRHFYARRVRRLLPAATVTTLVTCAVAYLIFDVTQAKRILVDGIWASLFSANWHFISVGTDYFAATGPASPFEHYWSLSVEEQFYVVWPVLLFAVMMGRRGAHSSRSRSTTPALATIVLLTVISVAWAWWETTHSPVAAYFSTLTRAWELGVGAALALVIPRVARYLRHAAVVSWVGLAIIAVSAIVIDGTTPFPAPGAIAPVVGSLLVITAASRSTPGSNILLRGRPAVALGDASYAIYLVHLPVIVFMSALLPHATGYRVVASTIVIAGASWLLHVAVERPFMSGRRPAGTPRRRVRTELLAAGVGTVLVGCSVVTLWPGDGEALAQKERAIATALAAGAGRTSQATSIGPGSAALQQSLRAALQQSSWPSLDPTIPEEEGRQPVPAGLLSCGDIALRSAPECSFGDPHATHTAYLIGDSTSMAYAQAFKDIILTLPGWRLRVAGAYGCSFASVLFSNADDADVNGCRAHNDAVIDEIGRVRPDVVLVTNTYTARQEVGTGHILTDAEWSAALTTEVARLGPTPRIALMEPAPLGPQPSECYDPGTSPAACAYRVPVAHRTRSVTENDLAQSRGWTYISTQYLFCEETTGYCPAFAGTVPIKHDTVHVAYAYDDVIAPVIDEALRAAKVFG